MSRIFIKPCMIRFAHCDPAGIVFHPNFYVMFNGLVEDWFREGLNLPWENMSKANVLIPVVSIKSDFMKPFHIGDQGEMRLWVSHIGNSSFTVEIEFYKGTDLHVTCSETMVCIDPQTRRSTPIPTELRARMQDYHVTSSSSENVR
ncbi:MAG TPA: acyl-CoA thioesterase [Candidatus Aphodousia faecipullorum]|nr:acyl-CoA thioesterase [Candidatus Aphodousia faecipullorum]